MKRTTKKYEWGTRDFVEYAYEDWLDGNLPKEVLLRPNQEMPIEIDNQQYEVGFLPQAEYERIANKQQEVAANYIAFYIEALKKRIKKKMNESIAPKSVVENEYENVKKLLTSKDDGKFVARYENGNRHQFYSSKGTKIGGEYYNAIAYWHQKIAVEVAEKGWRYIEPKHVKGDIELMEAIEPLFAEIFWQYQNYLKDLKQEMKKGKKLEIKKQSPKSQLEPNKERRIRELLNFLSNPHPTHGELLTPDEFERLINYLIYMFEHEALPEKIESIQAQIVPAEIIRYAIHSLHRAFTGKNRKLEYPYIEFLQEVFPHKFSNWELKTLKAKFSEKPSSWDYWSENFE